MYENIKQKKGCWKSFSDIDGLGHNCWYLLEDRKGNIWIGTLGSGLNRYDGKEFVSFTTKDGLAANDISCLLQDEEGNLWIGTGAWSVGNGISRYDGKNFVNFSIKDGLPDNYISCLHQDREGNIWIGTGKGLSKYDGKKFVNFSAKDGLIANNISCVYQDRTGNIWIGTGNWGTSGRGLSRYDGKEFVSFTTKDGLADNNISSLLQDKEGNLWIGTGGWGVGIGNGLSRYDGKNFVNFSTKDGLASDNTSRLCQDQMGNIWISTQEKGVSCYDGAQFVNFSYEDGLANSSVWDIIEDREGSLWFACWHGGVCRYSSYGISSISDESVAEVMIKDKSDNYWWGHGDVLSHFDGKEIRHYPYEDSIYALLEDSQSRLWVGTRNQGVFICDNIKNITRKLTMDERLANSGTWKIYEDIAGNIWIGTGNGLIKYDGNEIITYTAANGLGSSHISEIYQDSAERLWFAGWMGGGLTAYDGKNFRRYTTADGLVDDRIVRMLEDDKSNLWIGTLSGISCYDGQSFKNYTIEDGLLSNTIQRITQDRRGNMWIATLGGGVSRFDGKNFQALTTEDGLPSNNVTGIIEDSDGNMIISSYKGIVRYQPNCKVPPLIRIDEVDADKIYEQPQRIQISESIASIRIKYHGTSFKTSRLRYSYRLEGYDQDWRSTWDEEVRYESLPAGEYNFKVVAINKDFGYSEKPAELRLRVTAEKFADIGELASSIAHEIHNPLTAIKMRIYSLEREGITETQKEDVQVIAQEIERLEKTVQRFLEFAKPSPLEFRLIRISAPIGSALKLLEPKLKEQNILADIDYIDHSGKSVSSGSIKIEADDSQLEQLFLNLFINAIEAMPNGGKLKVAASLVSVYDQPSVQVEVSDSGEGIDSEKLGQIFKPFFTTKASGHGLGLSIVNRIVDLHQGQVKVESQKGSGTKFTLIFPASKRDESEN